MTIFQEKRELCNVVWSYNIAYEERNIVVQYSIYETVFNDDLNIKKKYSCIYI